MSTKIAQQYNLTTNCCALTLCYERMTIPNTQTSTNVPTQENGRTRKKRGVRFVCDWIVINVCTYRVFVRVFLSSKASIHQFISKSFKFSSSFLSLGFSFCFNICFAYWRFQVFCRCIFNNSQIAVIKLVVNVNSFE